MARLDTFTDEEKQFLIENYSTQSWEYLLEEINKISPVTRDKQDLISKASSLNIRRNQVRFGAFSTEEEKLIQDVYLKSKHGELTNSLKELIETELPHRTLSSIETYASKAGIIKTRRWTQEEYDFILTNYYTMTTKEMANAIARTEDAVYNVVRKFGLRGAPMSVYTEEDKQFVRENYLTMSDEEIGIVLHRKRQSIKEFRRKLGLKRPRPDTIYNYDKYIHRHNIEWKKDSAKNCNYKCVITGEEFDDIHHLYARNLIIRDVVNVHPEFAKINFNKTPEEERVRIFNIFLEEQSKHPLGVCLKKEYHIMFHQRYGTGGNTPDQFYEFIKDVAPERLDYIMNL